jgi:hypothetical protein
VSDVFDFVSDWLTVPEVADKLGIVPGKVRRLIEENALFVVVRDGVKKVPAHLIVDGEPLPSIPGTLNVLIDAGFGLERAVEWLYTVEESLGRRPIESLLLGSKSEVRRIAQTLLF